MPSELSERGIRWLTPRERGLKLMRDLAQLADSEWKTVRIERTGRCRRPQIHDELIQIKGIEGTVRQLAVRNIGREQPTLLIINDLETSTKALFARYAERRSIENELDAYISGFHLDALLSGLPLHVDLDTTLTVIAGRLYRLLARRLPRDERATPDRIWRHFLDATGTIHTTEEALTVHQRAHLPPRADRRRPRRAGHPDPLARRTRATVSFPAAMKPQRDYLTENRG